MSLPAAPAPPTMPVPASVVVTGAASQVGFFLLQRLAEAGCRVVAVSRRPQAQAVASFGERWPGGGAARWIQADLEQPADDSWTGGIGVVTAVLDRIWLRNAAETVVMTCGPEVMMTYTIKTALSRGIPRELQFLSMERNMNCAVALCGHCQFGPHFLCREGPVFSYRHLRPLMRIDDL